MAARLLVGWQPHHMSPLSSLPCACTLRETVGAARKRDRYGAAERACGPLQPHTRREREREREVNGSTPPRGMAAASHVSSLLSAMRVRTERDSGSREETGPVRSSRESLRASAATHTQRVRERGEWQHASSWEGSCITCLPSPLCHARAHGERQWEPRGNGTGTEQQREPAGLCSHTHAEGEREENGSTPPRGMAAVSPVPSLLSARHARAH